MKSAHYLLVVLFFLSCTNRQPERESSGGAVQQVVSSTSIVVLGTVQDGGSPHIGCRRNCCSTLFDHPDPSRQVVALGLLDIENRKKYLFEATPDLPSQMKQLTSFGNGLGPGREPVDGIFLTHAHIGHYTGLMYLGKEAMDAKKVPVYAMPRMKSFLETNGPWSQLVARENIELIPIEENRAISLSERLKVTPLRVPHRDEYSETVGYLIEGPSKRALFIPDIDKWSKWERDIVEEVRKVDYAFLDATFYSGEELNTRDISEIPHPLITESMDQFSELSEADKQKVIFIHFNHTNPVLDEDTEETNIVSRKGFRIARRGAIFEL